MQQVAEAAHALHESGTVHRDIKPGNIMVTADGRQAVLMDLGLAQLADEVQGRLARTRQFVGTLRYASPEQVLAVGKLDGRTDVYSMGATLWELLTLRPMFGATEQTPTPELMQRIQYEEPARLCKYHLGIARDVDAIVLKCLEKDPKRRYATAQELGQELGRFLAGEPVHARPVSSVGRFRRWCKFGLTREEIIAAIRAGKLHFRKSNMHGNPWLRLLRHEVEALVRDKSGLDHLRKKKLQKELTDLNQEARKITTRLKAIERRRAELSKELEG
jgi:serine/threonine protein kinase